MASEFRLSVVAPDRSVVDETVTSVVAPGANGYLGVLAGHVPLITSLRPGVLEYLDASNQRHYVHVGGGFAEITQTRVTVLADEAQPAHEIDVAKAEQALERARRALRGEDADMTSEEAMVEMERAMNRVRTARMVGR